MSAHRGSVIWRYLRSFTAPFERIGLALIKLANCVAAKPVFLYFKIGTEKKLRWELFDRKTDGLCGGVRTACSLSDFDSYQIPDALGERVPPVRYNQL